MRRVRRSDACSPRRVRARARLVLAAAIAAAAGFTAVPASAGIDRAGTTAANFLSIGSGAGVLGMGGAGLGLDGGLAAAAWNPATLARLGGTEVVFSHAALGEQTAQEWAGVAGRLRFAGLSGAVTGLFQSEGSFEGRDALNNPTGTFDVSSVALGFGVARALGPFMTAGVGLKYASENLGGVRGSGVTFDAGLQVRSGGFGFGAAAQNAFGRMNYDGARYDFPSSYGLGVSYEHAASGLRVALDMNFPPAYYSDVRGGVEWRWNDRFALRTGYRAELGAAGGEPLGGPTFGTGVGARGMWFDYGYLVGGGAGQHRIGITFHPGALVLATAEPAHGGREPGYASAGTIATPKVDAPPSAPPPASPRATPSASAPATATATAPAGQPASAAPPASPRATPSAPASANAPASAAAKVPVGLPASAAPPASPRATPSARAPAIAPATPRTGPPAGSSAPASPPSPASAVASPGASAGGPAAVKVSSAPPTYTQRAKAARGTSEASASDRKTAAAEPGSSVAPRPPVAPQASGSATAVKSSPAAAAGKAASTTPAPVAGTAGKPDSAAARPTAATGTGTTPSPPAAPASRERSGSRPEKVRVKNGQTMADIARTYGTSVPAIMMENNLVSDRVRSGQVLRLPAK